jgi:hypothetical protein
MLGATCGRWPSRLLENTFRQAESVPQALKRA